MVHNSYVTAVSFPFFLPLPIGYPVLSDNSGSYLFHHPQPPKSQRSNINQCQNVRLCILQTRDKGSRRIQTRQTGDPCFDGSTPN